MKNVSDARSVPRQVSDHMGTSINTVSRCTSDDITVSSEALSHYFLLLSPCDAEDSVQGKDHH